MNMITNISTVRKALESNNVLAGRFRKIILKFITIPHSISLVENDYDISPIQNHIEKT